jgi:predicted XRE-type DNA-binding protein
MSKKHKIEIGCGSAYADLEYKSHEEIETKADLTIAIKKEIKKKKLTQSKAAKLLGISQPKLSELLRGRFSGYSVERLMHFLTELGKDVNLDHLAGTWSAAEGKSFEENTKQFAKIDRELWSESQF